MTDIFSSQPPKVCHFFRLPLEIRDVIYRMLLTTQYCTLIASTGASIEFRLFTNILLVNKKISSEATRVLWEENDFVILKVIGLNLQLGDIPVFKFLSENKLRNPVLSIEVENFEGTKCCIGGPFTIITTLEGVQSIVRALWRLDEVGPSNPVVPLCPADLNLSLNLKIKTLMRSEILRDIVLKPWERVHGINKLTLTSDIINTVLERLGESMLQGPSPNEAALTLREYHTLGQIQMSQKNYSLALCSMDDFGEEFLDEAWKDMWTESARLYFAARLELVKIHFHQSRYKDAVNISIYAQMELQYPRFFYEYKSTAALNFKFYLCTALARTFLGEIEMGMEELEEAGASYLASKLPSSRQNGWNSPADLMKDLQMAVNVELVKLNSPYRCEWPVSVRVEGEEPPPAWQGGEESRSFEELLDLEED